MKYLTGQSLLGGFHIGSYTYLNTNLLTFYLNMGSGPTKDITYIEDLMMKDITAPYNS